DDGSFDVVLPKGVPNADVVASAPGFAVACVERARPGRPVEVRLEREGVLECRVVDVAGRPVVGAAVRSFRVVGRGHVDEVDATSGGDGSFRVGGWTRTAGDD